MSNRIKTSRLGRILLVCCVAIATAITPLVAVAAPAQAAPVAGFNAGNIIDDSLFYNGNTMSAAEIQSFLNQRLSTCRIGTPGYMPGAPSPSGSGNIIASNCLKSFRQTTTSQPADQYCAAYSGATNETSAQIIEKVGRACGISQKVLLVMLEKEQSLLTDDWPVTRQYNYALGMNCPDSGPNGSANCDAASAGFSKQLYLGARQLKVYKGNPNSFNYKPFQNNAIQWHPNVGCGTSSVYIENWATAALYIYTPYRPNQAALNAGWGTGDSCSSYGNRNFYNFYTSWFGSTQGGYTVSGDIGAYWNVRGGANSVYGYPAGASTFYATRFSGGLWLQYFSGGIITTELNTGKTVGIPFGQVFDYYNLDAGGIRGALGAPVAEPAYYAASGGATLQWFQGGLMITSNATGRTASVDYGPVYDLYNGPAGGIYGALGYPTSSFSEYSGGKLQNFQRGIIAQMTGATTPVFVSGEFFTHYNTVAGGIRGRLGFPVGNLATDANGTQTQEFANGFVIKAKDAPVVELSGAIFAAYRSAADKGVILGAPVGDARVITTNGGATFQQFQNGIVVIPKSTGLAIALGGKTYELYNNKLGGFAGPYGYPTSEPLSYTASGGGTLQYFEKGIVFTSVASNSATGMLTDGDIFKRYNGAEGGIRGWLGYPIEDEITNSNGSRSQKFQNGVIAVTSGGSVLALPEASMDLYLSNGVNVALGAQESVTRAYGDGRITIFKNGIIAETGQSGRGVASLLMNASPIFQRYNASEGGLRGWLGYPIENETTASDGFKSQKFQNGSISIAPNGLIAALPQASMDVYRMSGMAASLGAQSGMTRDYGNGKITIFANGMLTEISHGGGTVAASLMSSSPIFQRYNSGEGGLRGWLGYPIEDEVVAADGSRSQQFQNGVLRFANGVVSPS